MKCNLITNVKMLTIVVFLTCGIRIIVIPVILAWPYINTDLQIEIYLMLRSPCGEHLLKHHFISEKVGFAGIYTIFLIFA